MGFFSRKSADVDAESKVPQSEATTAAPSGTPSIVAVEEKSETVAETTMEKSAPSISDTSDSVALDDKTEGQGITVADTALAQQEVFAIEALAEGEGDDTEYPKGGKLLLIVVALMLAVFLVALDNTIIATAIPKITDQFQSLNDVGWYGSAYLLATCALQLSFGKIYTFYPIKWVFLATIAIFEVGSAVCGAAPSSNALIVGRAVAGIGSAGIFSGALIIIAYSVPLAKRPAYTGIIGGCYGLASIAGPLLGGAFTDGPGWPWCFYINLPLGAVTMLVIFFFFKNPSRKSQEVSESFATRAKQLDLGGVTVFVGAIISLLLALQWGGSSYAWSNWRIILCFVIFGVLAIVFVAIQWYMGDNATVPFRIIKQRSVAAACGWSVVLGGSFFVLIYWLPIWFQAIKGASALKSGIMCIPLVLALVLANIVCGIGTTIIGYYNPFYYASVVFASIGAGLLTTFTTDAGAGKWIGFQIIYGLGIGFGMQQSLITVQTVLPLKDIPVGTALAAFTQMFGGALFVSVAQNTFNNRLISELPKFVPNVNPAVVVHTGATNLRDAIPAEFLHGVQIAYNTALTNTWYISVVLSCLSVVPAVVVEWRSVKGMKPGVGGGHA